MLAKGRISRNAAEADRPIKDQQIAWFDKLAAGLTGFSTALARGERVLIDAFDIPDAMVIALVRAIRARGAHPYVQIHRARITRELALGAEEDADRLWQAYRMKIAANNGASFVFRFLEAM